ncbi:hypothetical protein AB0F77_23320 [Streptomyces sp. NPDC026672]|uniref:hypothetical protein n=1 Tax=unclassified Streptomyces TaxID=2593676 RepID=UPI0033C0BBE0
MDISNDLRKTLSDPTPLYFAAGTADLALQQARKVPALVEQLRSEAPARIEAVRHTDPKAVQERAAARAKEAQQTLQSKVNEFFGTIDGDLKKLGESAQDLALRGVGVAAEYAVKARETYEKVAEHGELTVRSWRGEAAEGIEDIAVAVEPKAEPVEVKEEAKAAPKPAPTVTSTPPAASVPTAASAPTVAPTPADVEAADRPSAKKPPVRKPTAKKTTPPAK